MKRRVCLFLLILVSVCFLTGCEQNLDSLVEDLPASAHDAYEGASDGVASAAEGVQSAAGDAIDGISNFFNNDVSRMCYTACTILKLWAPTLIVGSMLIGFGMIEVFKRVREIEKFALTVLVIKLPIVIFILVYVFSYLYGFVIGMRDWNITIGGAWRALPDKWYATSQLCSGWAFWVMIGSALLGLVAYEVFKANQEIRAFARKVLLIKVPLVIFVFVYFYAYLYKVFT